MRGKKAKRLRKQVYGNVSIRGTQYFAVPCITLKPDRYMCVADDLRYLYQQAKGRRGYVDEQDAVS